MNSSTGIPEAASAATKAEAPGTGTTLIPCRRHRLTSRWPGSEIAGVPASLTSATFAPCSSSITISGARVISLCS